MKKFIFIFIAAFFACVTLSAQIQTELEFGVNERNFLNTGAGLSYDFGEIPLVAGFRVGRETGIDGYSVYNPTHYAGVFARAYSGKGMLRAGCEIDMEISQRWTSGSYSGYDNRRAVYFRPCIACFADDCFGVSLNVFRFGWWSGNWSDCIDFNYGSPGFSDLRIDFRTVSVSIIYKFSGRLWQR